MNIRRLLLTTAALVLLATAAQAAPPCAGFNDVDANSPFCPNVQWMANRGVTLGCAPGLYCPQDPVIRLSMAAFLSRLGTTLTPRVIMVETGYAATDLDTNPILCQSSPVAITDYPRSANAKGSVLLRANGSFSANMNLVMSTDDGTTWAPMTTTDFGVNAVGSYGDFTSAHAFTGLVNLEVGSTYKFGLRLSRAPTSAAGQIDDGDCHVAVELRSRTGAGTGSSPI